MSEPEFTVVVCALSSAGSAASLRGCLSALAATGVTSPLVVEGKGPLSLLRNRALAACTSPLVAFVDQDVEVARDWLPALSGAWESADERVGCIGGPIALVVRGERPAWLSDELAAVTGVESGPNAGQPTVGGGLQTFLGGNLSFRINALAGIGGFWPATGAPGLRDRFGEEHHAQHELSRAGWKTTFAPAARAERVVDGQGLKKGELLRLRSLTSARRSLIGYGSQTGETKAAAKALAGSAAAAARANRRLAAERLARAAGHLGSITAARTGGATLEPASTSTEFLFSVPVPGAATATEPGRQGPEVYCFHRVTADAPSTGLAVTPEDFASTLDQLLDVRPAVTVAEATSGLADPRAFAVTFDDGYADNLQLALPILESRGVPATFFVATEFISRGDGFWWDDIARLLEFRCTGGAPVPVLELACGAERRSWAPQTPDQANEVRRHINAWLQPQDPALIKRTVAQLRSWAGLGAPGPSELDRPMSVDELRALASHPLANIGAHTRSHPCLAVTTGDALRSQLVGAADDLEEWTGSRPDSLAYPFGVWGVDVTRRVCEAAEAAGYSTGFVNGAGPGPGEPLARPRTGVAGY